MNLANSVLRESPKFKSLGHPTIDTADIRNLDDISATIVKNCNGLRRGTERDDRLGYTHDFETTSETTAYRNHIKISEIETREVFERETSSPQNIQQILPMNIMTRLDNNQLTRSTDSSKHEERHEPEVNPDPEPSSSDLSSNTSSSYSRSKKKKSNKKRNCRKQRKDGSSDPSSSDDSDSSDDSYYRRKRFKKKKHRKKDPIKLCATLTAKFLTTAYKSKIIRFKMDEDPLQCRIYFLTFVESLEMIFSQYKVTCEVLIYYPKTGGDDIIA